MPYCTQANLDDRFGTQELIDLTDRDGLNAIDVDVLAKAIADADAEIDGYLEKRYRDKMPFSPVPAVLERLACNMARYYLYTHQKPEPVEKEYQNAVLLLKRIADGTVSLGSDEQPPTTGGLPQMQSGGRIFDRTNAKDFI